MSRSFTFASIARPSWRYRIYRSSDDNPAYSFRHIGKSVDSQLSQFDTMGDGEVQHSPDCLVMVEDVVDVIISLAASLSRMNVNIDDEEFCDSKFLSYFWRSKPSASDAEIQFCLGLKFNPKKETYYTFIDDGPRKSTSENKKHDKRWMRLSNFDENTRDVAKVLSLICTEDSKCKPYGIIQHIATVMRIARLADSEMAHWAIVNELRTQGTVFERIDKADLNTMLNCFERITAFKNGLHDIRWTRNASRNHMTRMAEEKQLQNV